MESLNVALSDENLTLDDEMTAAGCDQYQFGPNDDLGFELALELARSEAPGVVGWLEFIKSVSSDLDPNGQSADVPQDCEGAMDYVRNLVSTSATMMELPVSDVMAITGAMTTIQTKCTADQVNAFFTDEALTTWMGG
jgi:hypothetical protein